MAIFLLNFCLLLVTTLVFIIILSSPALQLYAVIRKLIQIDFVEKFNNLSSYFDVFTEGRVIFHFSFRKSTLLVLNRYNE